MNTKEHSEGQPQVATSAVVCDGVECSECEGYGNVHKTKNDVHSEVITCRHCNGTGRARDEAYEMTVHILAMEDADKELDQRQGSLTDRGGGRIETRNRLSRPYRLSASACSSCL